jgi:hypothetical protein
MLLAELTLDGLKQVLVVTGGLVGLLVVTSLVLGVTIQCKKLFGKTPPMHEQIKTLRDEFIHTAAIHEAEDQREMARLEQRINASEAKLEFKIDGVDRHVRGLEQQISVNGELRKNHMLAHIDDVRRELDKKIDTQTQALNEKIDVSTREQTKQLITVLKGKNDD